MDEKPETKSMGQAQERFGFLTVSVQEIVSAKPFVSLGVADHRLNGRMSFELACHGRWEVGAVPKNRCELVGATGNIHVGDRRFSTS